MHHPLPERYQRAATKKLSHGGELTAAVVTAFALTWLTYGALDDRSLPFLDGVNLMFHEAGHALMFWAPEYAVVLGGTLMQLAVPILCAVAFLRQDTYLSATVMFWWLGQNLVNISLYIADARTQALPLLGGDAVGHDWAYLLGTTGLLAHDTTIASGVFLIGATTMVGAILFIIDRAWRERHADRVPTPSSERPHR